MSGAVRVRIGGAVLLGSAGSGLVDPAHVPRRSAAITHLVEQVILAEVLALRMLYLNTVQILGRGRELGTEDLKKRVDRSWKVSLNRIS